ncbi:hypothetical protein QUB68_04800 [Microcoleus sp. A006_D1]|uniref:hypothetical protein n=1 Tax=Microcoleus sp. A006_D1 TaxID=3055267 RepID=UPI002FD15902
MSTVNCQLNDRCTTADDLRATAELRIGYKIDIYSIALLASYPTQQRSPLIACR